jgi:DNA-directed RNA polymerase alpha subunit
MTRKQALAMLIKDIPFTTRTRNCLSFEFAPEATVQELTESTPERLLALPNFGKVALMEVMLWLSQHGLRLYTPIRTTTDTASNGRVAK